MKRRSLRSILTSLSAVATWLTIVSGIHGQALPVEIRQEKTPLNFSSAEGRPLSDSPDPETGDSGRLDPPGMMAERGLTTNAPTRGQFQGFVAMGAVVSTAVPQGTSFGSYADYAVNVLPGGGAGGEQAFLRRAYVGTPFLIRQTSLFFGSIVHVPRTDEFGEPLGEHIRPEDYWMAEPYSTDNHLGSAYYWSPHARRVFAVQSGPLTVVWRRAQPSVPAPGEESQYVSIAGQWYRLFVDQFVVSGSPVKQPRRMYWTEGTFGTSGMPVSVPEGVHPLFIYTSSFPESVEEAYRAPGASLPVPPGGGNVFEELRTIFFDQSTKQIRAYNWQGRVLLELLGDLLEGNRHQHLGYEIVDVVRRVNPADVTVELGDRLTAWQDGFPDDSHLLPRLLNRPGDLDFIFQHSMEGRRIEIYATRVTMNQNDFHLHWAEEGLEGMWWPYRFTRYKMDWPRDVSRYSHYMRPLVETEAEARETAILLPTENGPAIEYQDTLDRARAKITETFAFYTHLDTQFPAHRTLLRFMSAEEVRFERVFSWLADALEFEDDNTLIADEFLADRLGRAPESGQLTPIPMLDGWDPFEKRLDISNVQQRAPRVLNAVAVVGSRISPPDVEPLPEFGAGYWAGHIRVDKGDSFHPGAYLDPFVAGFETANLGAIIPVNAIPARNNLEVWWFRRNGAETARGFRPIYWPSVVARYTLNWPEEAREIVLASNRGSGPLSSLEAKGRIYYQNYPELPGYNPNEEHALMVGGQAWALRDDLNVTDPGDDYSSEAYVLLEYTASDGRIDMTPFRVLREKAAAGWVFDYVVEAGTILQPPMPLAVLGAPVLGEGAHAWNFNYEPIREEGDVPVNWNEGAYANGPLAHYGGFTFRDRKNAFWVYRGLHAGPPPLEAGSYDADAGEFHDPEPARLVAGQFFQYYFHASHQRHALTLVAKPGTTLPDWLSINGLTIQGIPPSEGSHEVELVLSTIIDGTSLPLSLEIEIVGEGEPLVQGPLAITSINPYTGVETTHANRPPYLAVSPSPTNSFTMRFYYKTLAGFAWPGIDGAPSVGSIVPYLRPVDEVGGFRGEPGKKETESLDIVYRPVWPVQTPSLSLGDTLMLPKLGLPAVRGQTSLQVLYQQSIADDVEVARLSAVLHDPTREKEVSIAAHGLDELPGGVRSELYQGKRFFPNLPPHLVERFFFDPFRGEKGHLVFKGEFRDELFGEKYVLLNVARGEDLEALKNLCPEGDEKSEWDAAVEALAARVETFHENPQVPGQFIPDPDRTVSVGIGDIVEIDDHNTAVDSYALSASGPGFGYVTLVAGGGAAFTPPGEPVSIHIIRVIPELYRGELKVIAAPNPLNEAVTMQHTADLGGRFGEYEYDWRIAAPVDGLPPDPPNVSEEYWIEADFGLGLPRYTLGGANIRTLADNYLVMRYRPNDQDHPLYGQWSPWTEPQLAEGWIKRVLAGINPFQQRITDLFNNQVTTDVSMLTQAGRRWEGDIALNLENINDFGLIEIYETVLRRGRMLSIDAGINYGPANDALLLAAGYLNDLYMFLGNEAWADASNPTIGIGTANQTYGDIATSMFAFKGQVGSLLEEELALMRGRDDFLLPGVRLTPVYNRLVWNYTRGIDAGEVIYAINYNIQEKPDGVPTGIVGAEDAARMFPQGHGDAYGHYLTALKNYYSLKMSPAFDWVPRIEAVLVLGQPVSVDYFDERKFAAAAAAVARAGRHTFDLTWRQDYRGGERSGWQHFGKSRENSLRGTARHWGMDHWATRTGIGAYVNWVVGNAMLPAEDPDPTHEGIQKIDRMTVLELAELPVLMDSLQTALNNAEAGLTPLGLPEGGIAFDITPSLVTGSSPQTHFEQIYDRAVKALRNAVAAFDDAKDVTRLMRSEEDSLVDFQTQVARQELSYKHSLIELYGTPYPDDIGPGRTYRSGYDGPDLLHYMHVDLPELSKGQAEAKVYRVDIQKLPGEWQSRLYTSADFVITGNSDSYILNDHFIEYEYTTHGFFGKPASWTGVRRSPGRIQQAISELIAANERVGQALDDAEAAKNDLDKALALFEARLDTNAEVRSLQRDLLIAKQTLDAVKVAFDLVDLILERKKVTVKKVGEITNEAIPRSFIVGLASGGDVTAPARAAIKGAGGVVEETIDWLKIAKFVGMRTFEFATETSERWVQFDQIAPKLKNQELREQVLEIGRQLHGVEGKIVTVNEALRTRDDAERRYRKMVAEGDRIQEEREIFRRRAASVVHGYRTRDAAFRIFRQEKLERYKTLFDLAAKYSFLAANAYDYETGLLGTNEGREFVGRIVAARALGMVRNGEPQFAGSATGDPGLSSVLAEMKADWDVLKGRLGFNNPDGYGTTVSLRRENFRILPGDAGESQWRDVLHGAWRADLMADADVRRYAMQLGGDGFPVPGLVLSFRTTIAPGRNLFGNPLAAGDHNFSPSSFVTKIFAAGVALEGYIGMSDPGATTMTLGFAEGESPGEPVAYWLDQDALSATPYIYLIPVGYDSMRTPPLGDAGGIRVWNVHDVTVPLPFNVGASQFSTLQWWQSSEFLTERMFSVRKHQAFRPVSSASVFSYDIYGSGGQLKLSQFTNNRLIGRSVWNSEWKLVIPGETLLADPEEGIRRFIDTVNDIKLHFVTYSYSGN